MDRLGDKFEQVWVINLKRRADRLEFFWDEINKANWPFRRPQVFNAIDGEKVGVPEFWRTGAGSYGCIRSHLILLERAIQDDVESILILEDDAVFENTFRTDVANFLRKLPDDWQCLMLGGEHASAKSIPVTTGIVRPGNGGIRRTHCYALRGAHAMKALYRAWASAVVHCDWVMGPCMATFNTYAPDPFLVGQNSGNSDISRQMTPLSFWRPRRGAEPVVILRAPLVVVEALREKGWHTGYWRDSTTGIDVGLRDLFGDRSLSETERGRRLKDWIKQVQGELIALGDESICTIWHPEAQAQLVRKIIRGKVLEITATTPEEALSQLPTDLHAFDIDRMLVVLLRASREVMEALAQKGWHCGYWRDSATGQDNGVRRLFASTQDRQLRSSGMRDIVRLLHDEIQQIPGGLVTIWHDEVTLELLDHKDIEVIEIEADSAEEAICKFSYLRHN